MHLQDLEHERLVGKTLEGTTASSVREYYCGFPADDTLILSFKSESHLSEVEALNVPAVIQHNVLIKA